MVNIYQPKSIFNLSNLNLPNIFMDFLAILDPFQAIKKNCFESLKNGFFCDSGTGKHIKPKSWYWSISLETK